MKTESMGVFVFLPLVLPLTAWPIARLAEHRLHPRTATWLLTWTAVLLAVCSTLCLALLMVVGTAQLPGNPLPDGWSDLEVREALPYDEVAGRAAIPALLSVLVSCLAAGWRHCRVRKQATRAVGAGRQVGSRAARCGSVRVRAARPARRRAGRGQYRHAVRTHPG